jgi:pyridoxal 5'-phosphate synthase pdxS subunit
MKRITTLGDDELMSCAKQHGAPYDLVQYIKLHGKLPVPNFSAGGIATPADASLVMQLGAEAVFVGSGIFKSSDPPRRAHAIVLATKNYLDARKVAEASRALGDSMPGLDIRSIPEAELLQVR